MEDVTKQIQEMLENAQKQTQEMLENAQKQADKIIKNARKIAATDTANGKDATEIDTEVAKNEEYMKELVEIQLFKDSKDYKDDVFVRVNDKTFQIKRGEKVNVPRYVKDVLDNMKAQEELAIANQEALQAKYEATLN